MKHYVRSYIQAMRASARFGRAGRLRDAGKKEEALRVAREALMLLSHPHVVRSNPAEGAVLSCATVFVEELASQLQAPGANHNDVVDAMHFLRAIGPTSDLACWLPYLEQRAALESNGAA
jgi:hypothetical protein